MNKKNSRYRRLCEIRAKNSLRRFGFDPKGSFTLHAQGYNGKKITFKNQLIITGRA